MKADDLYLELSAGIYGVQNMHLFKLRRSEVLSSLWQIKHSPWFPHTFPEQDIS